MKNKLTEILTRFASFILRLAAPPKCAICEELLYESGELCPYCLDGFAHAMNRRCPRCSKAARSCTCRPRNMFFTTEIGEKSLLSLTYFAKKDCTDAGDIVSRKLVYSVKKSMARDSARFSARQLSHELLRLFAKEKLDIEQWYITYPPRSKKEITRFGFDQSKQLASLIAEYTGMKFACTIERKGGEMQKNLSPAERKFNADSIYFLSKGFDPKGKRFIIVDDVITTGATVSACAMILTENGATDVFPISIARLKKKKRLPKRKSPGKLWFKK